MNTLDFILQIIEVLAWPIVVVFIVLLFKVEISAFLKGIDEIKTKWIELRKLKEDTEQLRKAMKHTLEAWTFFLHTNQQTNEEAKMIANAKFSDAINSIADMVFKTEEEKVEWANKPWFKNDHK